MSSAEDAIRARMAQKAAHEDLELRRIHRAVLDEAQTLCGTLRQLTHNIRAASPIAIDRLTKSNFPGGELVVVARPPRGWRRRESREQIAAWWVWTSPAESVRLDLRTDVNWNVLRAESWWLLSDGDLALVTDESDQFLDGQFPFRPTLTHRGEFVVWSPENEDVLAFENLAMYNDPSRVDDLKTFCVLNRDAVEERRQILKGLDTIIKNCSPPAS